MTTGDLNSIDASIDSLGKSAEVKRFLLATLLVSRFHLTSRPISQANDSFFHRISNHCDKLLETLRKPGWPELLPEMETGLEDMRFVADWSKDKDAAKTAGHVFKKDFYKYFRGININWSHLTPVDDLTINRWQNPKHILIAFGPNIGIGDELIFFRVARRLAKRYPASKLEVISFSRTLWDNCDFISKVSYPVENQLAPFSRAKEILNDDNNNFVIFAEFATAPLYRNLEVVPGINRFIYLDTGSRVARIIDKEKSEIFEYGLPLETRIYETLSRFLDVIGLSGEHDNSGWEPPIRGKINAPAKENKKIFINPFSSKDYKLLGTGWWVDILKYINNVNPVEVVIFAGINDQSRGFAGEIADKLNEKDCRASLYGNDSVPTILDTIETAIDTDLVLGLDTFTGHVNILQSTPCISVFFGSRWYGWYVPDTNVFNVSIHDDAEHIGKLAKRLLWPAGPEITDIARPFFNNATQAISQIRKGDIPVNLIDTFRMGQNVAKKLEEFDSDFSELFSGSLQYYAQSLEQVLNRNTPSPPDNKQFTIFLEKVIKELEESNFYSYIGYIVKRAAM